MLCFNVENENQPTHAFIKKHNNNYYSINDCPVNNVTKIISKLFLLDYNFIVKERKIISCHNNTSLHLHIEMVNLADGEYYELVPADSRFDQEVNLNCANLSQDLGQAPEFFLPDSAQEGKPRCIMPYFPSYYSFTYL